MYQSIDMCVVICLMFPRLSQVFLKFDKTCVLVS